MYTFISNSQDKISKYLFNLISNLNESGKFINGIIDELLMVNKFNKNGHFLKFINHFNSGNFFMLKCEGYLKCLIDSKFYDPPLLAYFINEINMSLDKFSKCFVYFDTIKINYKAVANEDLDKLIKEINNFIGILKVIKDILKLYNLPS